MESAIATGAKVILFFSSNHDEKNTIQSEVKRIDAFRKRIIEECVSLDYNDNRKFEEVLIKAMLSIGK